ncbi:MAG TPA: Fic family protein [Patescibacteria group bacterium]|nr:Fic family protein [Patescibacteria group bacterium]
MADYFVDGDDVLENKLGITDSDKLKAAEQEIVTNQTANILSESPVVFGLDYLLHVHRVLFDDIYDFAGKLRTVDIAKPDAKAPFAYARFLESESKQVFDDLKSKKYLLGLCKQDFVKEIASLAAELNALHPFREGNGRTIRLFLIMLADNAGYLLDYSQISADELIDADKLAFEGDIKPLLEVYSQVITEGP